MDPRPQPVPAPQAPVAVVLVTRNRRDTTLATLHRLRQLPERPPLTVVDNASTDGTADAVALEHPGVAVVRLPRNLGAAGRNAGVALSRAPYVAFSDDDSWWAPGALSLAARLLDIHGRLAVVAARVLVGTEGRLDPTCAAMEASPIPATAGPAPAVLGFVACGAVVRRHAFLEVGGFRLGYGVGGEEELLAIDLRSAGWGVSYCPQVTAHHHPSSLRGDPAARRRLQVRNAVRTALLRRRPAGALRRTLDVARPAPHDRAVRLGLVDAARDAGWLWRDRTPVVPALEADLARLRGD